jgi:hypothetical protein
MVCWPSSQIACRKKEQATIKKRTRVIDHAPPAHQTRTELIRRTTSSRRCRPRESSPPRSWQPRASPDLRREQPLQEPTHHPRKIDWPLHLIVTRTAKLIDQPDKGGSGSDRVIKEVVRRPLGVKEGALQRKTRGPRLRSPPPAAGCGARAAPPSAAPDTTANAGAIAISPPDRIEPTNRVN